MPHTTAFTWTGFRVTEVLCCGTAVQLEPLG
jgi:hypothetical protein